MSRCTRNQKLNSRYIDHGITSECKNVDTCGFKARVLLMLQEKKQKKAQICIRSVNSPPDATYTWQCAPKQKILLWRGTNMHWIAMGIKVSRSSGASPRRWVAAPMQLSIQNTPEAGYVVCLWMGLRSSRLVSRTSVHLWTAEDSGAIPDRSAN